MPISASFQPGQSTQRPQAVFEESVATGGFRKVQPGEALGAQFGSPAAASIQASGDDVDETVPPDHSMALDLDWYIHVIWRSCLVVLTGVVLALVIIVEKQGGNEAAAISLLATFLGPLRLLMYMLSMIAWLGLADQYMQLRRAYQRARDIWAQQLPGASVSHYDIVDERGGAPRYTLAGRLFIRGAVLAQSVVAATVLGSVVMDNRIRMLSGVPLATIAADSTALQDFRAWRGLVIIRLAFCILALLCCEATLHGPVALDRLVAGRLRVAEASRLLAAPRPTASDEPSAAANSWGQLGPAGLERAMDAVGGAVLARMSAEEVRRVAQTAAALAQRAELATGGRR